jgi:hypothetical protein
LNCQQIAQGQRLANQMPVFRSPAVSNFDPVHRNRRNDWKT